MNRKLLDLIKVEQMTNYKDNPVKNQFIIRIKGCIIFQSYDSKIAAVDYDKNEIILFPDWNYSTTTGKYRNIFFSEYTHFNQLSSKESIERYLQKGEVNGFKIRRK